MKTIKSFAIILLFIGLSFMATSCLVYARPGHEGRHGYNSQQNGEGHHDNGRHEGRGKKQGRGERR